MKTSNVLKLVYFVLCLGMFVSFPYQAQAQAQDQDLKIAYVDARRLIDEAPQGKDEIKSLERKFSERSRDLKARIELYNTQEAELKKNSVILSSEELREKSDELLALQATLKREQQNYNEDYGRDQSQRLQRLEKLISEVIIEIAKANEIDLVLQQVVYASHKIDITDKVLEGLQLRHSQ
jgi:outer membrane protein